MGDAVMFVFDDAVSAASVLTALHRDFASTAEQFGLTALKVHSGAHIGEVTIAHDGDIYGQTVNIAARVQGSAMPGQIIVSESFALAAGDVITFGELDTKQFKNVLNPVPCREMISSPPEAIARLST
jgi:class 3 adenylate cyclase